MSVLRVHHSAASLEDLFGWYHEKCTAMDLFTCIIGDDGETVSELHHSSFTCFIFLCWKDLFRYSRRVFPSCECDRSGFVYYRSPLRFLGHPGQHGPTPPHSAGTAHSWQ